MIRIDQHHVAVQTSKGRVIVELPIDHRTPRPSMPLTERLRARGLRS